MKLIECGCCGAYHPVDFYGDCRDDANRYDEVGPDDEEVFEEGNLQ